MSKRDIETGDLLLQAFFLRYCSIPLLLKNLFHLKASKVRRRTGFTELKAMKF